MTTPTMVCPTCNGPWLYGLTFRHDPTACTLRDRDDATQYADLDRLRWRSPVTRPATPTEVALANAVGRSTAYDLTPGATVVVIVTATTTSVHRRIVQTLVGKAIVSTFDPNASTGAAVA